MATSKVNDSSNSDEYLDLKQCGIGTNTTEDKRRPTFGFEVRTSKTDLVLILEGKSLFVTRVVLEMISPVFEKLFSENLTESGENQMTIEGNDYYDFAEFLACIYPGKMNKISLDNVYRILPLAFEYEIEYAKKMCDAVLKESLSSFTEAELFKSMDVACEYDMKNLKKLCLKQIVGLYTQNIYRVDELAALKNEWRVDIYEVLTPVLRSDACKYKFWCVAKNVKGIQTEEFSDTKYVSIVSSLNLNTFMTKSTKFTYEIPALWHGPSFKIAFQTCILSLKFDWKDWQQRSLKDDDVDGFECTISFSDNSTGISSLAAVVLEFVNIVPGKQNLYFGENLVVSSKPIQFCTVRKAQLGSEKGNFILNGKITFRTHLLVSQPYV